MAQTTTTQVVTRPCMVCGKASTLDLPSEQVTRWWTQDLPVQVAFPDLSAGVQAVLISGTHPACWTALFAEGES